MTMSAEAHTMTPTHFSKPHHPNDVPEEFEPGAPPVEPDEGPVPAFIPDDHEHERVVDLGANQAQLPLHTHRQIGTPR
jgi:hypothetical protein